MLDVLFFLVWMLPAVAVWRRTGYWAWKRFPGVCIDCPNMQECALEGCNFERYAHGFNHWETGHHFQKNDNRLCVGKAFTAFWTGLVSLPLWPVIFLGFYGRKFMVENGHMLPQVKFFKAPAAIESKQEKLERRNQELETEAAVVDKRLKELGIEL